MVTAGPNSPSSTVDQANTPVTWTTPNNAKVSDGAFATCTTTPVSGPSSYLNASSFGFAISGQVLGILVEVQIKVDGGTGNPFIGLSKNAGTSFAGNAKITPTYSTTLAYVSYGGAADLWSTTWSDTDINSANFCVKWASSSDNATTQVHSVDHIRVTVTYTTPSGVTTWQTRIASKFVGPQALRFLFQQPYLPNPWQAPATNTEFGPILARLPNPHVGPQALRHVQGQPPQPGTTTAPLTDTNFVMPQAPPNAHVGPQVLRQIPQHYFPMHKLGPYPWSAVTGTQYAVTLETPIYSADLYTPVYSATLDTPVYSATLATPEYTATLETPIYDGGSS